MAIHFPPEMAEKYPEYAKACAHIGEPDSEAIGSFLEFVREQGWFLSEPGTHDRLEWVNKGIEELVCEYHGVNYAVYKREQEAVRREVLEEIRRVNGNRGN